MAPLSFHDKQHLQRVLAQQQSVAAVFNRFIDSVSPQLRKWMDANKSSVWVRNGAVESVIDRELVKLQAELMNNLSSFQMDAWKRSNLKNDEIINQFIESLSVRSLTKEGMFGKNMEAFRQMQNRVDNGMNLSDKVWAIADQTKKQIEFYLGSGVSAGQSAGNISRDVRQLLDNPGARFRRIRNADGKLIPSNPMKDYHPGAGVYRSAKMNALRMAATETNMYYRKSDHERWNKLDFVLGFTVKRSGNNKGPCSICDALTGEYPKEFVFTGWHPFCLCVATPILMDHDEFAEYLLNDTIPMGRYTTEVPKEAAKFFENNKKQFINGPQMKQNYALLGSNTEKGKPSATLKIEHQVSKKSIQKSVSKDLDSTGIYKLVTETENQIRMNKKFETGVVYDKLGNVLIDKRGASYSVSFTNDECLKMKDAIMTHNHPRGWSYPEDSMQRIGNSFSKEDIQLAIKWDLAEIRAVTPNYTFIMKRPEDGWGLSVNEAGKAIDRVNTKIHKDFLNRIESGTTTINKASTVHYHRLWKELSKERGWLYSKKKTH